jgi:hypothetical protein
VAGGNYRGAARVRSRLNLAPLRRDQPWHAVIAVVSSALGYAFSWLARDDPMDALVYAALAGLIGFLMVEYLSL